MTRCAAAFASLLTAGCLFGGGGPRPAAPVETVETTRVRADSLWRVSNELFRRGKWSRLTPVLERTVMIMDYADPRRARGYFMLGEAQMGQGHFLQAVREFRRVADEAASESLAPDALLRAGDAYGALWRRPELDPTYGEQAMATYGEVLERYPGTTAAARAQQRITELREKFAWKEYRAALFYFRFKAYDSAILSLRGVIANYPRTAVAPEALAKLVEAYAIQGYQEDLRETCGFVSRFYPQVAPTVSRTCPAVADTT
jgi:outer membrane protein assembly factor BamD